MWEYCHTTHGRIVLRGVCLLVTIFATSAALEEVCALLSVILVKSLDQRCFVLITSVTNSKFLDVYTNWQRNIVKYFRRHSHTSVHRI